MSKIILLLIGVVLLAVVQGLPNPNAKPCNSGGSYGGRYPYQQPYYQQPYPQQPPPPPPPPPPGTVTPAPPATTTAAPGTAPAPATAPGPQLTQQELDWFYYLYARWAASFG